MYIPVPRPCTPLFLGSHESYYSHPPPPCQHLFAENLIYDFTASFFSVLLLYALFFSVPIFDLDKRGGRCAGPFFAYPAGISLPRRGRWSSERRTGGSFSTKDNPIARFYFYYNEQNPFYPHAPTRRGVTFCTRQKVTKERPKGSALRYPPAHRRRALRSGPTGRRHHWRKAAAPGKGGINESRR